ncbi:hypothetical protein KI387_017887, partial [Taxus chinensis]
MLSSYSSNLAAASEVNMVLYLQETLSGVDATIQTVAGLNGTSSGMLAFGTVNVRDHVVTEGPHPSSKVLGRMQGFEARPDPKNTGFHMLSSIIFQTGKYNGSSLEIQGTNRFSLPQREVSVVGGTGRFRYAHGYALLDFLHQTGQTLSFKFNITFRMPQIDIYSLLECHGCSLFTMLTPMQGKCIVLEFPKHRSIVSWNAMVA